MKFKGFLSIILALCMLFSIQCISVFANDSEEEVNIVKLFATFNEFKGEEMTSNDNENFALSVKLDAGSYQFTIDENAHIMGHATTVKDNTDRISAQGLFMSETVDARCTLLATGGNYLFEYNAESNLLNIKKEGSSAPADGGENLTVKANAQQISATKGDTITYNVYLKTDQAFEDIQFVVNYDESKLSLTETTAEKCCPLLFEPIFNIDAKGLIAANSSKLEGYDFNEEKLLLTAEFTAVGTGEAYVDFIVQDMTILGGEKSYYFLSTQKTEGAVLREELKLDVPVVPTTSTEPAETTVSTNPATDATTPTTGLTSPTETVPSTTASSVDETTTTSTDPSETVTTAPVTGFELGDVNRDGKLNIRDATLIQKALAKLEQLDNEQLTLADYLTDGKVNIKDATQIQKKLANLL